MNAHVIRVVLADDHGVVRRGIREFLTEAGDIQVVAEAESGTQALAQVREYKPDVAVLDVRMPGENGIEVARILRSEGLSLGILMLSAYDDPPYIKAAIDAGANGYVLKSSSAEDIVDAVRAVHECKSVFASVTESESSSMIVAGSIGTSTLSEREVEVLVMVAKGLANKAIGLKLSISDRTVQGHLANIYEKLGASNRTEAVTRAAMLGVINVSPIPHSTEL